MNFLTLKRAAIVRIAAAGLAASMLAGCGQQSAEKLMASAKEYLAKGDRNAAVIQLKNLLTKAPDNGEARLLLGEVLLDSEDYVSAGKELSRAIELKQPQERAVPAYVRALLAQEQYRAVVTEVEKYKLFDSQAVAVTKTALGDAQMRLGNRSLGGEAYAAALAAVPGYPRARLGQASIIAIDGRVDEALKVTEEVISADPKLGDSHAFRADLLMAKGDRAGAKKAYEDAVAADARYVPARLALISMLTEDGDFEGASRLIESTRKVAPSDLRLTYFDAALALRKGDLDKARQLVQQVLKFAPDHVPSLVLAGAVDMRSGQLVAAEANLRKSVALAPNHPRARELLVQTYLRMKQPSKAKETLQPILDRGMPSEPRLLLLAGETYLASGDVQKAAAYYQAASKGTDQLQVAARTRMGQIALATGRTEQGFRELEAAAELDEGAYQADLALIAGHLRRKEFDKAMEAVKALEKKQPRNPLTFQMYGQVNLAKGDPDAARKSFEKALEVQPTYLPAAYNLAQLDILQKKPDEARKRYEAMIAKEPKDEQILLALADLQARTGAAPKEVIATLQRGVQADPQAPAARLALIHALLKLGENKAALNAAQEALTVMPSDLRVLDAAGVAQEAAGEVNQAVSTYNKLSSLQPQAVHPLYRLAALYLRQKDTEKAIESLRRVQKIAPNERNVNSELVQVYLTANRVPDALAEARVLQKREPKFAGGYALEGDILLSQRQLTEAERLYRQALQLAPRASAVAVKLHSVLLAAGKKADANALGKKWIAENPEDPMMRVYLGERELAARNYKAAAEHFHFAIEIDGNNASALNNLAWVSGQLDDPKAIGYAERAVKLAPNNASVIDTYGMLLLKKGETDKALLVMERARNLAPARNDLRLNYARVLIKAGKKDEARKELVALQAAKENFSGKEEVAGLLKGL